jgi:hypothetical protein
MLWRPVVITVLALLVVGCATGASPSPSHQLNPGEALLSIESGTQAVVGELRIGAANVQTEEYMLDGGEMRTGLTAGLWFSTSEAPASPPHVRVHPGQLLEVQGIRIRVLEILPDLVRIAVAPAPPGASPSAVAGVPQAGRGPGREPS